MAESIEKPLNGKGNRRGMHPNSIKNLENGRQKWHNPNGRPRKEVCLTSQLKTLLTEVPQIKGKDGTLNELTGVQLVALAWFKGLMQGNPTLLKEALERLEGKVSQPLEHTGAGGGPVMANITVASEEDKKNLERVMDGERT